MENHERRLITASHDYIFSLNFYYNEFIKSQSFSKNFKDDDHPFMICINLGSQTSLSFLIEKLFIFDLPIPICLGPDRISTQSGKPKIRGCFKELKELVDEYIPYEGVNDFLSATIVYNSTKSKYCEILSDVKQRQVYLYRVCLQMKHLFQERMIKPYMFAVTMVDSNQLCLSKLQTEDLIYRGHTCFTSSSFVGADKELQPTYRRGVIILEIRDTEQPFYKSPKTIIQNLYTKKYLLKCYTFENYYNKGKHPTLFAQFKHNFISTRGFTNSSETDFINMLKNIAYDEGFFIKKLYQKLHNIKEYDTYLLQNHDICTEDEIMDNGLLYNEDHSGTQGVLDRNKKWMNLEKKQRQQKYILGKHNEVVGHLRFKVKKVPRKLPPKKIIEFQDGVQALSKSPTRIINDVKDVVTLIKIQDTFISPTKQYQDDEESKCPFTAYKEPSLYEFSTEYHYEAYDKVLKEYQQGYQNSQEIQDPFEINELMVNDEEMEKSISQKRQMQKTSFKENSN